MQSHIHAVIECSAKSCSSSSTTLCFYKISGSHLWSLASLRTQHVRKCEKPPSVNRLPCVALAVWVLAVSNAFVVACFRTRSDTLLRASICSYLASLHIWFGLENECVPFSLQLCRPQQFCCRLGQYTSPQNHQQSYIICGCGLVLWGLDCVNTHHSWPHVPSNQMVVKKDFWEFQTWWSI